MQKPGILIIALLLSGGACGGDDAIDRPSDGNDLGEVQRQARPTTFPPGAGSLDKSAAGGTGGTSATGTSGPATQSNTPTTPPVPANPAPTQPLPTIPVVQPTTPVAQPTVPPITQPASPCSGKAAGQNCGASSCESETHRIDQVCDGAGQCVQNKVKCEDWCSSGSCTKDKDHGNDNDKDDKDKAGKDKD